MPQISKYWLFQLIGWLCFAIFNTYVAILTEELNVRILLINLLISTIGLILSHLFRNFILKHKLPEMDTEKLLITVTIGILLLSVVYNICYYICLYVVYENSVFKLKPSEFLGSFVAVFFLYSIWSIIYFAWTHVENTRRNLIERLKMESTMKDLELRTLRSNLQPHFIFNSLNSIRALIDENPELARKAITSISNILRNSITKQDTTDTLENELTMVYDYLALEKIRFEERLTYHKNIDAASLSIQVPTMMLQTLVENAIKHGISKLEAGGTIYIKTNVIGENLHIEIINTGSLDNSHKNENSLGFGIQSTKQRLQILYNNNAKFSITEKDHNVHVHIQIKTS